MTMMGRIKEASLRMVTMNLRTITAHLCPKVDLSRSMLYKICLDSRTKCKDVRIRIPTTLNFVNGMASMVTDTYMTS